VVSSKITSPSSSVRHQATSVLAALAVAAPPLMAKLLGSYLEAVEAGAQTLQMLAAPYSKPGVVGSSKLGPGALLTAGAWGRFACSSPGRVRCCLAAAEEM
jgi:hypothetical protein